MTTTTVILASHYGDHTVYATTRENAYNILETHIENIMPDIEEIVKDDETVPVSLTTMLSILEQILTAPEGDNLPIMQRIVYGLKPKEGVDDRPLYPNKAEYKQELTSFLFENNLTKKDIAEKNYVSQEVFNKLKEYSLFKNMTFKSGKSAKFFFYEDYITSATEYKTIMKNKWNENATEEKIVSFILAFVNKNLVDTSDISYKVIPAQEKH